MFMKSKKYDNSKASGKKKLPAWFIIPILIVFFLIIWFLSWLFGGVSKNSSAVSLRTVKAEKGSITEIYNTSGFIESEKTKTYYSPVTAPVSKCNVTVGQAVKSGDTLITFDTTNLERDNEQAQFNLQTVLNNSKAARTKNAETVDASKAASEQAARKANELAAQVNDLASRTNTAYSQYQQNIKDAEAQTSANAAEAEKLSGEIEQYNSRIASFDEIISAYEKGYYGRQIEINEAMNAESPSPAQQQIITDTNTYKAAIQTNKDTQILLEQAQSKLESLKVPSADDAGYHDLKAQYDAKFSEWQEARQSAGASSTDPGLTAAELENLSISDNLAELTALTPQELLEKGREGIKADICGVVSSIDILQTNTATQGMSLLTISSTDDIRVKIELSPEDYNKVTPGIPVTITSGGYTYDGTLTDTDKIALPNEKGIPVIAARIHINNPDENICIGASAKVKMKVAEEKNAVTIPSEAVNASSDGDFVYVIESGIVTVRNVELGISSAENVEIKSGLKEGDLVVNDLNTDIRPGMKAEAAFSESE